MYRHPQKWVRLELLKDRGFTRTHTKPGLAGERIWWRRTDTEMYVLRQRDEATAYQDLMGREQVLPPDTPEDNRAWAIELATDPDTYWDPD